MQPLAQTRHAVPVLFPATRGNPHTKLWSSIYATAGYSLVGTLHNFPAHPLPTTKLEELEVSCTMLRASRSATADHIRIQCRIAAAECYLCVLNCTKRDTLCQQRVQPRIQKLALANYQIPLSKCQAIPSKKHTMRPPFWESFLNPKMGDRYTPHLLLQ